MSTLADGCQKLIIEHSTRLGLDSFAAMAIGRAVHARILASEEPDAEAIKAEALTTAHANGMDDGATFCIEHLAETLGVTDYEQCDGTETWHGDVRGTLRRVLLAARVLDGENGRIARHPLVPLAHTIEADGTRESLATTAAMFELYGPECFPSDESGKVHFTRVMMESAAAEIRAFLAKPEGATE